MRTKAAIAIAPLVLLLSCPSAIAVTGEANDIDDLTLLATSDTHGTALNYDYFTGETFGAEDPAKTRGLENLSTAISEVRADEGAESVMLIDNGDANQGSSLETVYHANRDASTTDPIASLYNHLDYDSGTVGNHEFNYGLDDLSQYRESLDFPLLGANVIDRNTGEPYLEPYTMVEKTTADGHTVQVAVIGVVTPGVPGWDGDKVASLEFQDTVEAVKKYVPEVKAQGADVVVVSAHTGQDPEGYEWNPADLQENAARSIAENVSGVDVIVGGHSHVTDQVQTYYTNPDGREVLFTQPGYHARFLSNVNIPLSLDENGEPVVDWTEAEKPSVTAMNAADYAADPAVEKVIAPWHEKTKDWVAQVVATATEDMPAADAAWSDTAILDFINKVQTDELTRALKGTEHEDLPVVAEASPFSRTAVFEKGDVTIADMAALYVYDNTLLGVKMTGADLKDYLEHSARYYKEQEEGAEVADWSTVTNAQYPGDTRGIPDYSYDVLSGVNYHINISKPAGERIENLTWPDGTPVEDDDTFVMALNNYRQSGGSGYPAVKDAEVVYDEQMAIRDLMIQWAQEHGTIDPNEFFVENWTVGTSAAETPEQPTDPEPTDDPTEEPTDPENPGTDEPSDEAPSEDAPSGDAPSDEAPAQDKPGNGTPDKDAPAKPAPAHGNGKAPASHGSAHDAPSPAAQAAEHSQRPGGFLPRTGAEVTAIVGVALALLTAGGALVARRRKA